MGENMEELEKIKLQKKAELDRRVNVFFDKLQEVVEKNTKK